MFVLPGALQTVWEFESVMKCLKTEEMQYCENFYLFSLHVPKINESLHYSSSEAIKRYNVNIT